MMLRGNIPLPTMKIVLSIRLIYALPVKYLMTFEGQRTEVLGFWTVFEFIFIIAEYEC